MISTVRSTFVACRAQFVRLLSHPAAAWLVLLAMLAVTGSAWHASFAAQQQISRNQFLFRSNEIRDAIVRSMSQHENVLRGSTGLFAASDEVTRSEWRAYVKALALDVRHPGIQGIGFVRRLAGGEAASFVASMRAQGFTEFALWPQGARDEYNVIDFIEPFAGRNLRAFGYDMSSEATRRAALQHARDTGESRVTGAVRLVQETGEDEQRGFLMYLPVYRTGQPLATVQERRAALRGYVFMPFRAGDLMRGIFGNQSKELLYSVTDGQQLEPSALLFRSDPAEHWNERGVRQRVVALDIAGHRWTLLCQERTRDALGGASRHQPWFIAGAGLLIDSLLFFVILSMSRVQGRASAIAEEMTYELRESRERFRFVLDRAYDAFIAIDSDSRVRAWNSAAETTFGWSKAEILGESLADFIIPEPMRAAHAHGLRRFLVTGEHAVLNRRIELTARHKSGRLFPVEITITPMKVGESYQFNAFAQDISERKQVQEELVRAKEAAEVGTRSKSDFLARMSHEIRTPLNGMLGMTELLLRTKLSVEQRDYLETAHASGQGLLQIINDILDFSRIEAGKLELDAVPFSLRHCVGVAVRGLAARVHAKGLELLVSIPDRVPDGLIGDAQRLSQIILNLAGNALKFTERGEVVTAVEMRSESDGFVELEFRVIDTGVGIPESKHGLIFEAFSQADVSTHSRFGGTGLGLAICSQLVQMMHGKLALQSEVGRGSVFSFTARFARASGQFYAPDLTQVRQRSVLVAAENSTGRGILHDQLASWGMRAVAAPTREAMLAMLNDGVHFDLLLLDEQLTDMAPAELRDFMRQLRTCSGGSPILLLASAAPAAEKWIDPEDLALPRISKPVLPPGLFEHIQNMLGGRKPMRRAAVLPAQDARGPSCRVLVVEDNAVNRKVARALLEKVGHQVVCVENGLLALDAIQSANFDIVLMDVQMPEMDGLEATRRIRARESTDGGHLPIVALTAQAIKGDQERCLAAGMDAYVSKPIEPAELYKVIRQLMREVA
jgi:PAS domain S-box-containing protein